MVGGGFSPGESRLCDLEDLDRLTWKMGGWLLPGPGTQLGPKKGSPTFLLSCLPPDHPSRLTWTPGIEEDVDLIVGVEGQQELASL